MSTLVAPCAPNISPVAVRRRQQLGVVTSLLSLGFMVAAIALDFAWYARALVFIPAAMSATAFLQARRRTCVLRAHEGTFENDDGSTVPVSAADVAASRRVSWRIARDAALVALGASAAAAATSLL